MRGLKERGSRERGEGERVKNGSNKEVSEK